MSFGLLLYIPKVNSLIHSEYECDLIFTVNNHTDVIEILAFFTFCEHFDLQISLEQKLFEILNE